jgi:hypothetical protein
VSLPRVVIRHDEARGSCRLCQATRQLACALARGNWHLSLSRCTTYCVPVSNRVQLIVVGDDERARTWQLVLHVLPKVMIVSIMVLSPGFPVLCRIAESSLARDNMVTLETTAAKRASVRRTLTARSKAICTRCSAAVHTSRTHASALRQGRSESPMSDCPVLMRGGPGNSHGVPGCTHRGVAGLSRAPLQCVLVRAVAREVMPIAR